MNMQKGFSLIEVTTVLFIFVLVTLVIIKFSGKANDRLSGVSSSYNCAADYADGKISDISLCGEVVLQNN